jgi:hypothetical protein
MTPFFFTLYVLVFLPIWAFRTITGTSRFGRRFHESASAWDRPLVRSNRTSPDRISSRWRIFPRSRKSSQVGNVSNHI